MTTTRMWDFSSMLKLDARGRARLRDALGHQRATGSPAERREADTLMRMLARVERETVADRVCDAKAFLYPHG